MVPRPLLPFFAVIALAGPGFGQPPRNPQDINPKFEPNRKLQILVEPEVEDLRPYLEGKIPKSPKDLDPKVLQELMNKLNKMPKDQQPDKGQVEELLKNNPAFKNPEFLKQLEKML